MAPAVATAIRPIATPDLEAVIALEKECFSEPWPRSMFESELGRSDRHYAVAVVAGRIAGYGGLMVAGSDGHIMTLAVAPAARRRGHATRLLLELIEAAKSAGVEHLTLEVRESNIGARRLYESFGFREVGLRPGYYRNEDAVIMWAIDINEAGYRERLADLTRRYR
jgi:ribosomal-protein-alanine N-acetyltransferase